MLTFVLTPPRQDWPISPAAGSARLIARCRRGGETAAMGGTGYGRSTSQHAMIGRDKELADLAGLTHQTAAGQGQLIVIEGEPGIGKTLLLRTVLDAVAGQFPRTLSGTADEFDQRLPFATMHSCLGPLEISHRQVADVLALIRGGAAEYPVIESLTALI